MLDPIPMNAAVDAQPPSPRRVAIAVLAGLLTLVALPVPAWEPPFGLGKSEPALGRIPWSYDGEHGPEHWAEISPRYAACKGESQSPVDLRGERRVQFSPLSFHYRSNVLSQSNDGRSVRIDYGPGSYVMAGGHRYELTGFHFHVPGEHRINGVRADMELQLEHRDAQGRMAVVAVLMTAGRRMNSTLTRIWDHMPGAENLRFYGRQMGINPVFLLPNEHSYFSYMGSMTEPPCTEGVQWFVFAEPVEVDLSYVQRLIQVVGNNARPIQPLNGRPVLAFMRR